MWFATGHGVVVRRDPQLCMVVVCVVKEEREQRVKKTKKKREENRSIGYRSTRRRRKQTDACSLAQLLHFRRSQRSTQGHGSIASEFVPSAHGGHRPTDRGDNELYILHYKI
jgi:hypothetical protein